MEQRKLIRNISMILEPPGKYRLNMLRHADVATASNDVTRHAGIWEKKI